MISLSPLPPLLAVHPLATTNAILNALAIVLLILGYVLIRRGKVNAHKWTMLAAFAVSTLFLICYLYYHYLVGHVSFSGPQPIRSIYLAILISHILLAISVPPLAMTTIYLGLKDRREKHRRLAHWTFPIWLYVSITGVVIYVLLYVLYTPVDQAVIIQTAPLRPAVSSGYLA